MSERGVPEEWIEVEIGELCTLINGRAFKPTEWTEQGVPIIRIQNLNKKDSKFNYFNGEFSQKHLIQKGDLLFAWSGTPGTSFGAHIWNGEDAVLNQHIYKIEFNRNYIDYIYYKYAINHKLEELINNAQGGVGLRHVTKKTFESTQIHFPPLAEQKEIAVQLDKLLGQVESIKDRIDGIPGILKKFRQSVLAAAVSGKLTEGWRKENANDWKSETLTTLGIIFGGKTPSKSVLKYWLDGTIPWVSPKDMKNFLIESSLDMITELALKEAKMRIVPSQSILMVTRSGILSHSFPVAMTKVETTINQDLKAFIPNIQKISAQYTLVLLQAKSGEILRECSKTGTTVSNIDTYKLVKHEFIIPSYEEQKEIVRQVESFIALADSIGTKVKEAQSRVDNMTQSILAKAFSGDLTKEWREVNESLITGENSASTLLERIKEEQKTNP